MTMVFAGQSPTERSDERERRCNKCDLTKAITLFEKNVRYRGGHMPVCIACRTAYRVALKSRPKTIPATKTCSVCQNDKPIGDFSKHAHARDGHAAQCRACKATTRPKESAEITRERFYQWRYGIGLAEYEAMLLNQCGVCAICGCFDRARLAVDHDHSTGHVRGLLCGPCNHGLGNFCDDVKRMESAIAYLKKHGSDSVQCEKGQPLYRRRAISARRSSS